MRARFLIGLVWLASTGPAAAQTPDDDLCARLFVPEGYELGCALESDPSGSGEAAVVRPSDSAFAALSELSLRHVEEPVEGPAAWLRQQLTVDLSPVDSALRGLTRGPDSPITNTPLAEQLQAWRELLGSAATLPLAGCGAPWSASWPRPITSRSYPAPRRP